MRIRGEVRPRTRFLLGVAGVLSVLLLWWVFTLGDPGTRRPSPLVLPSPVEVVGTFSSLHLERGLMRAIFWSLLRVTGGFCLAALLAVPLGIAMAVSNQVRAFFQPLVSISSYVPVPALVPLTIAWFGIDEEQKVLFLTIAVFIGLLPMVIQSLDDVEDVYLQTGYTLGAGSWRSIWYILLPVAAPALWQSLRVMYGVGWSWIILAEVVDAQSGLGFLIQSSQRRSMTDHVFAVLLVIVLIAVLIDAGFRIVGRLMFPYEETN